MFTDIQQFLQSPTARGLATGLLQAGGPSLQPRGFGQALGAGLAQASALEQQAQQQQMAQRQQQFREQQAKQQLGIQQAQLGLQRDKFAAQQQANQQAMLQGPAPTSLERNLETAGFEKGTPEYSDAARQKLGLGPQVKDPEKAFNEAHKLRQQFVGLSKDFSQINQSYNRIQASAKDPSAAGDLALIFNYMKMLDPGSVVRESEFANAANAAGIPERIRATYNKALRGERLAKNQRSDFVDRAGKLFGQQQKVQRQLESNFKRFSKNYGLNPDNVIINFETNAGLGAPQVQGPAALQPQAQPQQRIRRYNPATGRIE